MTRTLARTAAAALIAAGFAATAVPASAGGSISLTFTPQNQKQAQAVQAGLLIYSIVNDVKGGANIRQKGRNNSAGIGQQGKGNLGVIHQEGKGHSGTLQQTGYGNSYGVFQFGKKTRADVSQVGNGNTGAVFQWGW